MRWKMKEVDSHWYETGEGWHEVVITKPTDNKQALVYLPVWLREHCPNDDDDYHAYGYHGDHRKSIYFFRDPEIAMIFTLRWA